MAILDKSKQPRLVYSSPVVQLSSNKTVTLPLEWDAASSSISISLPDLSFPLVVAFGLGTKIPDVKGGFGLSFPSFKFGAKGEVEAEEHSGYESDDEDKANKEADVGGKKSREFKVLLCTN